jgi:hypothetical protein
MIKSIKRSEALDIILKSASRYFGVFYKREMPKCLKCNKANKKWQGMTKCPVCGSELSLYRTASGQIGVQNPRVGVTKPGTGAASPTGGFNDRLAEYGNITYYDSIRDDAGEMKKDYRTFKLANLMRLSFAGEKYVVQN